MSDITKAPLIKWSGSKRKQAPQIVEYFPQHIHTYYEPFLGGGSVFHELLNQVYEGSIKVDRFVCGDLNEDLMNIWKVFLNDSNKLFDYYCDHRDTLFKYSGLTSYDLKIDKDHIKAASKFYYEERERFNHMLKSDPERPLLFFWITKTCFNGLIRYNPRGDFNVPYHVAGGLGQTPENLEKVMDAWKEVMKGQDIQFICDSYDNIIRNAKQFDIVYLDPPYSNFTGMYFANSFDKEHLFYELYCLNSTDVQWFLSYDGKTGEEDRTENVPHNLYSKHVYINSGVSNFKKLKSKSVGTSANDIVYDSLYIS